MNLKASIWEHLTSFSIDHFFPPKPIHWLKDTCVNMNFFEWKKIDIWKWEWTFYDSWCAQKYRWNDNNDDCKTYATPNEIYKVIMVIVKWNVNECQRLRMCEKYECFHLYVHCSLSSLIWFIDTFYVSLCFFWCPFVGFYFFSFYFFVIIQCNKCHNPKHI